MKVLNAQGRGSQTRAQSLSLPRVPAPVRRGRTSNAQVLSSPYTRQPSLKVHCSASSASFSGDQAKSTPEKGYAFLHDFCLTIPYGVVVVLTGAVAFFKSSSTLGVALVSAGTLATGLASLSLKCYHAGKKGTPFTAASAGAAFAGALFSWQSLQKGIGKIPSTLGLIFSAAVTAFLVYNIAAGGNPPKGEKPLEEAAPHPTS